MSHRIKVFISSTMEDLLNERDAVEEAIQELNFEPVKAENWLPDGSNSWDRIEKEIVSSDIFVLLVGERYGWIPKDGPEANERKSVTHLEFLKARELGLTVLPFLKILNTKSPRKSDDAKSRDEFRAEIKAWKGGQFVAEFERGKDLKQKVRSALVTVMAEAFRTKAARDRKQRANVAAEPIISLRSLELPSDLVQFVRKRKVLLLAGAGMSLLAGYPSAFALTTAFADRTSTIVGVHPSIDGLPFRELAQRFKAAFGRSELLNTLAAVLRQPEGVRPTASHRHAVRLMDLIVTTNYDPLFEVAALEEGIPFSRVVNGESFGWPPKGRIIVKISGTAEDLDTLVLTETDLLKAMQSEPYRTVRKLAIKLPLLIVGTSLRDASQKELLRARKQGVPAFFVNPFIDAFDRAWLAGMGITAIQADADSFFESLTAQVK